MKITTQYLVSLLSCIDELPSDGFRPDSLTARWQSKGRVLDDQFILHYEVVFDYEFLVLSEPIKTLFNLESLVNDPESLQQPRIKLSATGRDFLARYGV